jgi:hypothetical protein
LFCSYTDELLVSKYRLCSFVVVPYLPSLRCGINAWEATSSIVRASSSSPAGQYRFEETLVGAFAHEPVVTADPSTGDRLLYYIGHPYNSTDCGATGACDQGYTKTGTKCGLVPGFSPAVRILRQPAGNVSAPWTALGQDLGKGDINPSPYVFSNGSAMLLWRTWPEIHLARAKRWDDLPYDLLDTAALFPGLDTHGTEDPSNVWADAWGGLHVVFHDHMMGGSHAFADPEGKNWRFSGNPCYSPQVEYADGRVEVLQRRERPHVVLDPKTKAPIALSNGVQPIGTPPVGCSNDHHVYTLVVPLLRSRQ